MKKDNVDSMLESMEVPHPEKIAHQQELKIPLLRYRRSSVVGLWLMALPLTFVLATVLKYRLGLHSMILGGIESLFKGIAGNEVLTYLIPLIFVGLPLFAMVINLLAFCHFSSVRETKEILITVKYRPLNLAIFLLSFAEIVYFLLPDALP